MPELPEVETVRLGLQRLLVGHEVRTVDYDWAKAFPNASDQVTQFLIGARVLEVRRRAKLLLVDLSSGYSLVVHLKMTGQMVYRGHQAFGAGHPNDSLIGTLPDRSTRVTLDLNGGAQLFFNDQRKFGWMKLLPTVEVPNLEFIQKLGPEPLELEFTNKVFIQRIRRRNRSVIKAALLDQTVLAGIGNIYADESLWAAKIHPAIKVMELTDGALKKLHVEIKLVLHLAIEKGGSTDRNYVNAEGKKGSYIDLARVFRREGLACSRCGSTIVKSRVAGRGTHTCPGCQKLRPEISA